MDNTIPQFPTLDSTIQKYHLRQQQNKRMQDVDLVPYLINEITLQDLFIAKQKVDQLELEHQESRALGIMIGAAIGDALGAHFEGKPYDPKASLKTGWNDIKKLRFTLGLWTDDTALSLCIADSLIINNLKFDPIDLRHRFFLWWYSGYNNGCKNEEEKISQGIGNSTYNSFLQFLEKQDPRVPLESDFSKQVSGNGTIMRMSPICVAFKSKHKEGLQYSYEQGYLTHNSDEAADCCQIIFWASLLLQRSAVSSHRHLQDILDNMHDQILPYLKTKAGMYIAQSKQEEENEIYLKDDHNYKNNEDRDWNWRNPNFQYSPTRIKTRGYLIGIYACDCLAMALHLIYNYGGFQEVMFQAVARGGDADSLGSIVGILAGSFYGFDKTMRQLYLEKIVQHDEYNIAARAIKLNSLSQKIGDL